MQSAIKLFRSFYLLVVAVLLFVLFLFFPVRLDLSKNGAYTLSGSTRKIISSVNKPLTVTLYVSSDIPTRVIPLKNDVAELLQEYRRSGKNIAVVTVDPKKDPKTEEKLAQLGIPKLQFSQLEQNKYQASSFYFGIAVTYNDKNEVIPQVSDYGNLEYNISSAIYRLTRAATPKIAIVGEGPAYGQQDPLSSLRKTLSQQYQVSTTDLTSIKEADTDKFIKDTDALVVTDPVNPYTGSEIALMKKYFEAGKSIVVFAGGTVIDEQTLQVSKATNNLNELTATYGATINPDLALSTAAEYVNFGNETSQFLAPYPFWLRTSNFNTKVGIFSNIQYVSFPWVSTLTLKKNALAQITPLIATSNRSWVQSGQFNLDPNAIPQPKPENVKEYLVGAELSNNKGGQIIVIPSSRFVYDQYIARGSGNLDLALNAIDAISSNGALTGIRSRAVSFYPLPDLSDNEKDLYKYGAILLFPVMWGVYGLVHLLRRK